MKSVLAIAKEEKTPQNPTEIIKDPMILEFLGLKRESTYYEKDLETAIITHLQDFILELGNGFSFVARQKRIHIDGDEYFIDLVFYNRLLQCFVVIEIKTNKLTHQDIGQLLMKKLQECERLYTNFKDTENCDYKTKVDFSKNKRLAVHYYSRLIYNHFEKVTDAVKINFVKDVQIWFKDSSKTTPVYTSYKRFTIKVQFNKVTEFPELLVSFDGNTNVLNKSLSQLDYFPPELINYVKFNAKIVKYEYAEEDVKQHIEELYPILSNGIRDFLNIPRPAFSRGNKYKPYYNNITDFYNNYLNTKAFKKIIPLNDNGFHQMPEHKVFSTSANSNKLRFYNGTDIVPHNGMKNKGPYKASPHASIRFFFIYHQLDRLFAVKTLYKYFTEGYKAPNGNLYFQPLKTYIKQPFIIDRETSIAYTNTALREVKQGLLNLEKKPNTRYVAIYVTPINKTETDEQKKMLY